MRYFVSVEIQSTLCCPRCHGQSIKKNGTKHDGKQNYLCKDCYRQFVGDHNLTYPGCHSGIDRTIRKMLVRNCGIRDISEITGCSRYKVQKVLKISQHHVLPKKNHYDALEVDELWTFVGNKKNKVWLIYAYDRDGGEIVAYVWGKRDIATVRKLEARLNTLKVTYGNIAMDKWQSFVEIFGSEKSNLGKKYTVGIEGNNCRLRHRIRRIVRKTCCFSKKLLYHFKTFDLAFHYINYGFV